MSFWRSLVFIFNPFRREKSRAELDAIHDAMQHQRTICAAILDEQTEVVRNNVDAVMRITFTNGTNPLR